MATTWPAASSILETPQCAVPASPPAVVSPARVVRCPLAGSLLSCSFPTSRVMTRVRFRLRQHEP
jgi:hypothetical protein